MMRRPLLPRILAAVLLAGCGGEEPPVLRVGELGFSGDMLAGMAEEGREELADIASLGLALREGRTDSLLARVADRAAARSRLATLPYLLGAAAIGVDDARLRAVYAEAPEWELDVRHVVRLVEGSAPQADRREEIEIAAEVLQRAAAGEDFSRLAAQYSEEPGAAERGGALEPGREGSWVAPFWEAAVALRPGEVSPVVETLYGYHVLRLDDRRPVPFEEADRAAVLRRAVPASEAAAAMEVWAPARPPVAVTPEGVRTARRALAGETVPEREVLARGEAGAEYTARDLVLSWASLGPEERQSLAAADDGVFGAWMQNDAREALWAVAAERLGAPAVGGVRRDTLLRLRGTVARWANTFGLSPQIGDAKLKAAALRGVVDRGQEARIARMELRALRPLLRQIYPVTRPGDSPATSRSSEMRKSESTG